MNTAWRDMRAGAAGGISRLEVSQIGSSMGSESHLHRSAGDRPSKRMRPGQDSMIGQCGRRFGVSTQRPSPRVLPSRTEAEAATRAGDWKAAAERWYAIFMADPERPAEACAKASRAFLQTKDADSASHLLDVGLGAHPKDPDLLE